MRADGGKEVRASGSFLNRAKSRTRNRSLAKWWFRVKAVGVNFADLLQRMGIYPGTPKPPFVPGFRGFRGRGKSCRGRQGQRR